MVKSSSAKPERSMKDEMPRDKEFETRSYTSEPEIGSREAIKPQVDSMEQSRTKQDTKESFKQVSTPKSKDPEVESSKAREDNLIKRPLPTSKADRQVIPRTKKKRGSVIWSFLKLVLSVLAVFLLFFYGQTYIGKLFDKLSSTTEQMASGPETTEAENKNKLTLANHQVKVDQYPLINLELAFDKPLSQLNREDIQFVLKEGGKTQALTDYALIKEGQTLKVNFNDSSVGQSANKTKQLAVKIDKYKFDQTIDLKLPEVKVDAKQVEALNKVAEDNFKGMEDVALAAQSQDQKLPFVRNNKQMPASSLISWFILAKTYQAVNDGELTMEEEVKVLKDLKAEGDQGTVASMEDNAPITIKALLDAVIQSQDVTAMNHLIQFTGGPNKFNQWLSENNYFSTKINQLLAKSEEEGVTGATTSAQDVSRLLLALGQNKLVSPELDVQFKEALLQTPSTEKYPKDVTEITGHYEIVSPDSLGQLQYYSGILMNGDKAQAVVVMAPKAGAEGMTKIAQAIAQLFGALSSSNQGDSSTTTSEGDSHTSQANEQVSLVEETAAATDPIHNPNVQPAPVWDNFDDNGDGVPETYRQGNWYFDNASGQWYYN
ncbi:serine hydrolase [Vaginisenegalia massiliensis]|uniref:serine hydrolase n=1 Tax=Vaginisenegalia massiliensis TaxID=2058294 RepID=UPI0013DE23C2|nr:serine hydrolase [Vaginisenegalia massiliensis]